MKDHDETQAPLLEHLIELRTRLVRCVLALVVAFGICLYFADAILGFLIQPLKGAFPDGEGQLIFTKLYEVFFVELRVAASRSSPTSFGPSSHQASMRARRRRSCRSFWRPRCCSPAGHRSLTSSSCRLRSNGF